jgi:hypothetical protein
MIRYGSEEVVGGGRKRGTVQEQRGMKIRGGSEVEQRNMLNRQ